MQRSSAREVTSRARRRCHAAMHGLRLAALSATEQQPPAALCAARLLSPNLPRCPVQNKLLRIAERIKEKHRQQQEAAVEGSRRAGVLGGAKDLLQKVQKLPSGAGLDHQG